MTVLELIAAAAKLDPDFASKTHGGALTANALEVFYGHGVADETGGDAESLVGHFFRVDRWIVRTDSDGNRDVTEYAEEDAARAAFADLEEDFE